MVDALKVAILIGKHQSINPLMAAKPLVPNRSYSAVSCNHVPKWDLDSLSSPNYCIGYRLGHNILYSRSNQGGQPPSDGEWYHCHCCPTSRQNHQLHHLLYRYLLERRREWYLVDH